MRNQHKPGGADGSRLRGNVFRFDPLPDLDNANGGKRDEKLHNSDGCSPQGIVTPEIETVAKKRTWMLIS